MKQSTSAIGEEHEEFIANILSFDNTKRSRSSGASFHSPIDVVGYNIALECEATEKKSYRFTLDFWEEIKHKAHSGKLPAIAFRFRDVNNPRRSTDLIALDANDFAMIFEAYLAWEENRQHGLDL